jgi:aminoglycoside phosphotransferase (APT) family kinase protein
MSTQPRTVSELKKVAEGREAEMFAWKEGTILRLLRNRDGAEQNERQAVALRAAHASGVPVPRVIEITSVEGRPGIVMERVEGVDYLTLLGRQPWLVFTVGPLSGKLHARLHEVAPGEALIPLRTVLRNRIQPCDHLPDELAAFALDVLDSLPDGDRLYHGDFHPGNIMSTAKGPIVIDWTNACVGDPTADVARTDLLLRIGEPPPSSPIIVRTLARVGGRILVWGYLRSYRKQRKLDMSTFPRWKIPIAAARVSAEGIAEELPALISFLERARAALS